MGKNPYLTIFQELFILIGTTQADGAYLHNIFKPLCAKSLGLPVLLRVPSGKITADRLFFSIYSANPLIAGMACLGSLRSINTEPPVAQIIRYAGNSFSQFHFADKLAVKAA